MPEQETAAKALERSGRIAALLGCTFWGLSLGGIVLFGWMAAVGNLHPTDVVPLSGAVAALSVLWLVYSRVQRRRGFEISRHPDVMRERERRNF